MAGYSGRSPPSPPISMLKGSQEGLPKGKKHCHEAHGPRSAINIEIGGAGVRVDVHLTFAHVTVLRLYLEVVAKFIPSTDVVADFTCTEVECQQRHGR